MTNLYQITIRKSKFESSQNFKDHFKAAFEDILKLTKLLCQSADKVVKDYLTNRYDKVHPWLSFTEDEVSISVQRMFVKIRRNDADDDTKKILYDFDKRLPADDYFILGVMAILKHHLPGSILGKEVAADDHEFNDAVLLVALVNPKVCNPDEGNIVKGVPRDEQLRQVIKSLAKKDEEKHINTRKFISDRRVEVSAEPPEKVLKTDPDEPQEVEEEEYSKLGSPALL